jgi:hypothetical protein
MLPENSKYISKNKCIKPQKTINIPVSLFESMKGKYFVGQTKTLIVSNGLNAWAGLINPCNSKTNLFVNVFTISNFSTSEYLTAEIWLNTNNPDKWSISNRISPTNTALNPFSKNKVDIGFVKSTCEYPKSGVNVYKRIVAPNTTLIGEEDGKFIESPGGNYVVILKSSSIKPIDCIVAFGWWEKPMCH